VLESPRQFLEGVLLVIGTLLPIVGPLSSVPLYLQMTAGVDPTTREPLARLVAFDSFLLLLGSAILGPYALNFFGVSIADVQFAGGILVCALAWSLLTAPEGTDSAPRATPGQVKPAVDWRPRAFYPLTMPLTVGPGSVSVALTLGAHRASTIRGSLFGALADAVGMLVVSLAVYVCYRYGTIILRKLGSTGVVVLTRLSAYLLLCIGVHIAWSGARALLEHAFTKA